jgi:PAS domain S-box-containing protein
MLISGEIERRWVGRAKLYYPSQRVPVSALLDYSSDYILVINNDMVVTQANKNYLDLLSVERDEIIGQNLSNAPSFIKDNPFIMEGIKKCLLNENPSSKKMHFEVFDRIFHTQFLPTTFNDGSQGATIMMEDVTEEKKLVKSLKESDIRAHDFIRSSPHGFVLLDSELRIIEANEAAVKLVNATKEDVIGETLFKFDTKIVSSGRYEKYKKILEGKIPFFKTDILNSPLFGDKKVNVTVFGAGEGIGLIITDITEYVI